MKCAICCSMLFCGVLGAVTVAGLPAQAQFVGIPVSNGSFALQGTAGGVVYSSPMTLLSPVGTINITSVPLPIADSNPTITTNTPIGTYFRDVSGTASLNDGRTANFPGGQGYLKLESLATASNGNSTYLPNPGVTVTFNVESGSLVIPQANVSAYPATIPQVTIPISGGSFAINASTAAQIDTVTVTSVLTPLGTANLLLTFPDLSRTAEPDILLGVGAQNVVIHGVANGTVSLTNGNVATVDNRLVTLTGTAAVTAGTGFWYGEQLPTAASTVQVTITGGSISVPQSAVSVPGQPTQPTQPIQPTPVLPPTTEANPVVLSNSPITSTTVSRPVPSAAPLPSTSVSFAFAEEVNFVDQSDDLLRQLAPTSQPQELPEEEEISPLAISRIHSGLRANF